ncbi:MAG: oxidoreductase, partial [Deltaproteobacteria bacterium]|nr:oxidoreductase [Deltaproteobacteria bacterium]
MVETIKAIVADKGQDGTTRGVYKTLTVDDLPDHDVLVDVAFSTLNYKDALAVIGVGKI